MKFDTSIVQARFESPLGPMIVAATARGLAGVWFEGQRHLPDCIGVAGGAGTSLAAQSDAAAR